MSREKNEETARMERAMADLLALDDTDGPAPHRDDLSKRRWINEIVALSDASTISEIDLNSGPIERNRRYTVWAAVCAAVLVALGIGLLPRARLAEAPKPLNRLLSFSGQVRVNGRLVKEPTLSNEDRIEVSNGAAVLVLKGGVTLYMEDGSRLQLFQSGTGPAEVYLEQGRIVAAVTPSPNHNTAFSVRTDAGRAVVTGTFFSVAADLGQADLKVLEGSVRVEVPGEPAVTVLQRQGIRFAEPRALTLNRVELIRLKSDAGTLALLTPENPAASTASETNLKVVELQASVREEAPAKLQEEEKMTEKKRATSCETLPSLAEAKREAGDWDGALSAFRDLLRCARTASEAGIALIAMGDIQLTHKHNPNGALSHFDAYLSRYPGGELAQEAAFGRIRALMQLRRDNDARAAAALFIARFPKAVQVRLLKKLLPAAPVSSPSSPEEIDTEIRRSQNLL